jgi:predicted Mrr-cat superfamily restriction endonuclease
MPWNFAFTMKEGDWVICPSSSSGYLLVGKIEGNYISNFHGNKSLPRSNARVDFIHLRKVNWLYAVSDKDARYKKLHRIGLLTVVQPDISIADLKNILSGNG